MSDDNDALVRQIDGNALRIAKAGPETLRRHALQRASSWTASIGVEGFPDEDSPRCAARWQYYADNAEQVCVELRKTETAS